MMEEERLINSLEKKHIVSAPVIEIPNTSGDHLRGLKRNTPSLAIDLVNKKYVDDSIAALPAGHTQGTDQALDTGGANEITAANAKAAYTHSQDNTQAHSDYLLNSGVDEGVGLTLTGDNSSTDTAYVPMVLYNTDATPPAASGFPIGTIYIQYTP